MDKPNTSIAQQLGLAASAFEKERTGHMPKSVSVVLSKDTLVITLHEALSPAEKALARSPAAAAKMQDYHRQMFSNSAAALRQKIEGILGVGVREASAEVQTVTGAVMQWFASGTVVQVFLLAANVAADAWSGNV